ncbi:hypothetical protein PHISCL_05961 [Aspergillus sclerotialis]|uniref:Uncharacterized protein n=1 Tax=Aspergillus sclerotialis TaxID=2070753 RepID=A0A3A2ZEV7_9EURO|nr:hypothetical protein PHISCL_05961 [Aspergillus sclerotialis]
MSRANLLPAALAIGFGVGTAYYTLQPALVEYQREQARKTQKRQISNEAVRTDPANSPITVQDPGSTPRNTWTEKIFGTKQTAGAEAASPATGADSSPSDTAKELQRDNQQ